MKVTLSPQDDGTSVEVQSSSGDIYQEVNFGKSTGKQFIAVHNKKTKKVKQHNLS